MQKVVAVKWMLMVRIITFMTWEGKWRQMRVGWSVGARSGKAFYVKALNTILGTIWIN